MATVINAIDATQVKVNTQSKLLRTRGENGADSLTALGVGDPRVALFFRAVRGASADSLDDLCSAVLEHAVAAGPAGSQARAEVAADLPVLAFHTRDIEEGKGERHLFTSLLLSLHARLPSTTAELLQLVPEHGSYRDLCVIAAEAEKASLPGLKALALKVFCEALRKDNAAATATETAGDGVCSLSLAGKWAPREGSSNSKLAKELAEMLFPGAPDSRKLYRQMVARLNKRLGTVEVMMAGGKWEAIRPDAVPARCLNIKRFALLNKVARGVSKGKRRSEDPGRVACAQAFAAHLTAARKDPKKARVHGAKMQPHELVRKYIGGRESDEEDDVVEAQWVDLRQRLKESAAETTAGSIGQDVGLGMMVPMVDVSGSMSGTPMEVAIALGLVVAELTHPAFRDRMLTFSESPEWHQLPQGSSSSLRERVASASVANWGMNTNFQAAFELILKSCVEHNLPPSDIGCLTLLVLSDMQFDQARGVANGYDSDCGSQKDEASSWESQYELLRKSFAEAGLRTSHNKEYPVPRVIFWNLRGDTNDYPANASTPGVAMLGGFSASLLKLFLQGDMVGMQAEQEQLRLPPEQKEDAYQVMRRALDHPRFRAVREVCAKVGEGPMEAYRVPDTN